MRKFKAFSEAFMEALKEKVNETDDLFIVFEDELDARHYQISVNQVIYAWAITGDNYETLAHFVKKRRVCDVVILGSFSILDERKVEFISNEFHPDIPCKTKLIASPNMIALDYTASNLDRIVCGTWHIERP